MHLSIIAIGKMQRGPEMDLMQGYLKRLSWKAQVIEIEIKKPSRNITERKAQEATRLLEAVPSGAAIIALDERGKNLTSREFAGHIERLQIEGISHLAVIIGGADGLDDIIRQKARLKLAFGTLTWPHMLVRAMLTEQLYRAQSILSGHPYHRD